MSYTIAVNALVVLHFAFVCFVLLGGLLVFRWRWVIWLHIPAAFWGALIEYQGWICPLTPLEQELRRLAGTEGYTGGFIENYLLALIYPSFIDWDWQIVLGTLVVVVNIIVYGSFIISRIKMR